MKKLLFLAAVVMAAGACSRIYDVNPAADKAIDFGTWAENLTKGRTPGSNKFANEDNFAVYGYKLKGTDMTVVFQKETGTGKENYNVVTSDGTTWSYSPTRFWDQTAESYTFYAVSPASIGNDATVDPKTGKIPSTEITFAGNNNDILVANKATVVKADFSKPVTIHFNHIASLVDFKVKKHADMGDATVAITSFKIVNIANKGTYAVNSYDNGVPVATWNATDSTDYNATAASYPSSIGNNKDTASDLITNLVVMPQTFKTTGNDMQKVVMSYTITSGGSTNTYTDVVVPIHEFDRVDDTQNATEFDGGWAQGKHYVFYITINSNAIVFSAEIGEWTTEEGYYYLVK